MQESRFDEYVRTFDTRSEDRLPQLNTRRYPADWEAEDIAEYEDSGIDSDERGHESAVSPKQ
jgi:hypothetical protein